MKIKEYVVLIFGKYKRFAYICNNNILHMKYCAFLGCLCGLGLSLSACQKSESESILLPEREIVFVRGYDEAFALASQSIGQ